MFQRIKSSLSTSQSKTKPCSAFKKICSKLLPLEKKEVLVGWCLESDMRGRDSVRSFEWKFKYNPCLGSLHTRQSFAKFRRSEGRRQSLTELCSTNPALSSSSHISTNWLGKTPLNDLSFCTNSDQVIMFAKQGKNRPCSDEDATGEISSDLYRFVQCDIKKCAFDSLTLEQNPQNCD